MSTACSVKATPLPAAAPQLQPTSSLQLLQTLRFHLQREPGPSPVLSLQTSAQPSLLLSHFHCSLRLHCSVYLSHLSGR